MEVVVKKHEDYGNDSLGLHAYFPFGLPSYVQMMHVKTQRLVSLAKDKREPNFESVKDSLNDLINYAIFTLDHLEGDPK
jgi:CRISPR/Cas system-associated endonuclease Cas1